MNPGNRLLAAAAAMAAAALLGSPNALAAVPAGTSSTVLSGGPLTSASRTSATAETFSSPAVGDLNGDGETEIVAGYTDGTIHVWNAATGVQQLVITTGPGAVESSPALVDLYHDGRLEILAGNTAGQVFVYDGHGRRLFFTQLPAANNLTGVFATPTVAYLDNTSTPWIVVSSWGQHLYAVNLDGQEHAGFPVWFQDTSWSSPTIAYLDSTGFPDIVVGYDCSGVPGDNCAATYHQGGGYVTVINHNGQTLPGWPRFLPGQVIWSTPAVGALTGPGSQDIVVGTGLFWPSPAGSEVLAYDPHGNLLPGWPVHVGGRVMASPAIGHVTNASTDSVAVTAENGMTYLIEANGQVDWARCSITDGIAPGASCPQSHASPILADVAGTGSPQVIGEAAGGWTAYSAAGTAVAAGVINGSQGLSSAPSAVNLAGHATLLFTSRQAGGSYGTAGLAEYTFPNPLGLSPWPTFKQNMVRSGNQAGVFATPTGTAAPTSAPVARPSVAAASNWVAAAARSILGAPWDSGHISAYATALHNGTSTETHVITLLQNSVQAHQYQVTMAYQKVFHRNADPSGLATWTNLLGHGSSVEMLRADLAASGEYRAHAGGSTTGVVEAYYELFLGRPADRSGQAAWVNAFNHGAAPQTMAMAFQNSVEGTDRLVNEAFVTVLHRAVDPSGMVSWATAMHHGLNLMHLEATLTGSGEFFAAAQR